MEEITGQQVSNEALNESWDRADRLNLWENEFMDSTEATTEIKPFKDRIQDRGEWFVLNYPVPTINKWGEYLDSEGNVISFEEFEELMDEQERSGD